MSTETEEAQRVVTDFVIERFPPLDGGIEASTPLLESGLVDSIGILEIVDFIEDRFDIVLEDEDLVAEHFETVTTIAALVRSRTQE